MIPKIDGAVVDSTAPTVIESSRMDPNVVYPVREFLDDQHRIVVSVRYDLRTPQQPFLQDPDGRSFLIHTRLLGSAGAARHATPQLFKDKYGPTAKSALLRFKLVVDFLNCWQREITWSGFADEGQPMAVREEFLRYLLRYRVHPQHPRIPEFAIGEFLDEWGHRWF